MSFAPVRLGNTVLEAETAAADRKSCRRFGPCGVGEKALYLNDLLIDRHFYVGFGSVRRVFKRVAMSQGGFSGKGAFGSIPYLVVQYDDGQEKQCTFKREEDVDELLAYLGQVHPEIPRLSVGGEQRLAKKAQQEASRYLKELTPQAQSAREELERARKFLSGYPELTAQLAAAAKAKRIEDRSNHAYRWVAMAIMLAAVTAGCGLGIWFFLSGYRRGLANRLMALLRHIPLLKSRVGRFVETHKTQLDAIDMQITALHGQRPASFILAVSLELACRILSALEIYFILLVLTPSVSYGACILILAFTSLLANLLFFMPLQLGGREGGFLLSTTGLGMTANAAIFVALLVRLRELVWTGIGLLLIKVAEGRKNSYK